MLEVVRKKRTAWLVEHLSGSSREERDAIEAALAALEKLLEAPRVTLLQPRVARGRSPRSGATATTASSSPAS